MSTSSSQWFAQLSLGMELGPMPTDELVLLAKSGSLLKTDKVRLATDDTWFEAHQIDGLFDFEDDSDAPLPASSDVSEGDSATLLTDDLGRSPDREPNREPVEPTDRQALQANASPASDSVPIDAARPEIAQSETSPTSDTATAPTSLVEATPVLQVTPSIERPTSLRPARRSSAWGGVLLLLCLSVLVVAAMWCFWPSRAPAIHRQLAQVHAALKERRAAANEPSDWSEFVRRSKAELQDALPWLESHSDPHDRSASLLLFAGRDLEELLDHPRQEPYPHEARLEGFMSQLREQFGSR